MRPVIFTLAMAAGARAARVVPMSISKATPEQMGLDRRSFPAILSNNRTAYYTKIQVGTPPQTVTLHVDTGSADLWYYTPPHFLRRYLTNLVIGFCQRTRIW
jgi:hypothetical protein